MATVANDLPQQVQGLPAYGLPMREVLDVAALSQTRVLAGAGGMDRLVAGVEVTDGCPDPARERANALWLLDRRGARRDDRRGARCVPLLALVRDLHAAGSAALAVRPGGAAVPADVLAAADDLDFLLLCIPGEVVLEDVVGQVTAALNRFRASVLEQIDALHAALTMIVLEGGDLDQIAAEVARVLSVGVVITSTDGREWASAVTPEQRADLSAGGLLEQTGRLRVERARSGPVAMCAGEVRVLQVAASGAQLARLVVVSTQRRLRPSEVYSLERAATVAALLITRQQAVNAVEGKYRGDFLRDVFESRAGTAAYVAEHAEGLGWDLERPVVVVVAQLDPDPDPAVSGRTRRADQDRFAAAWRQVVEARDRTTPVADFSTEVVALLGVRSDGADVADVVGGALCAVRGDQGGGRRSFSGGISRVAQSIDELPAAYAHARRAVEVGRKLTGSGSTTYFDSLGVRRLLALIDDDAELTGFAEEVLGPLVGETASALDLRTTMQVLLDTNLNVAEAARLQHFHYNTMRYRVAKLEGLLGPFSTDPALRLDIAVALQIHQLAE